MNLRLPTHSASAHSPGVPGVVAAEDSSLSPTFDRYGVLLLVGAAIYLCTVLFSNLTTPFFLIGDQMFFWMDAQRLMHAERVYVDFFQFTPPGADLLYLGAFNLFGPRIWVPNLVVLILGIVLCALCYHISRSVMERRYALLAAALFVVFPYGQLLNATHHWFSALAVMCAVAVLLEARTPTRIIIAGALLGTASFFTQTRGLIAAAAIAVYLIWAGLRTHESRSRQLTNQIALFTSLSLTWLLLSSHYLITAGWQRLWFFQVTYVLQYQLGEWTNAPYLQRLFAGVRNFRDVLYLACFLTLPFVFAISFWYCRRRSLPTLGVKSQRIALLALAGTAMYLEVARSPNSLRFYCIALPGLILLVWVLRHTGKLRRSVLAVIWAGTISIAAIQVASLHRHLNVIAHLPAGTIATNQINADKMTWIASHTQPGQFFFQAGWPGVYLPLQLRNPTLLEDLQIPGASELGYVDKSIRQLESQRVQYVLWSPRLELPLYSLGGFREYLGNRYRRVWTFSDQDEVWERRH